MELPMLLETGLEVITECLFSNVGQIAVLIFHVITSICKVSGHCRNYVNSISFRSCHKD